MTLSGLALEEHVVISKGGEAYVEADFEGEA